MWGGHNYAYGGRDREEDYYYYYYFCVFYRLLLFLSSMGSLCGVGVLGMIGRSRAIPALQCRLVFNNFNSDNSERS